MKIQNVQLPDPTILACNLKVGEIGHNTRYGYVLRSYDRIIRLAVPAESWNCSDISPTFKVSVLPVRTQITLETEC